MKQNLRYLFPLIVCFVAVLKVRASNNTVRVAKASFEEICNKSIGVFETGKGSESDHYDPTAFITTWRTTTANETIVIPTTGSGYDYIVDWGDGTASANRTGDASHTYLNAGDYKVSITGAFPRIFFEKNPSQAKKIIGIDQWGTSPWASMDSAFEGCGNLQGNFTDEPDLSHVTTMKEMFALNYKFNGNIEDWDVSKVTDMSSMFFRARSFTGNLSKWDVSHVMDMSQMFYGASLFNGDIGEWDVSSVETMKEMFALNYKFNGNIEDWDVSKVTDMSSMFFRARSFTGNLSKWDVSHVMDMSQMFYGASLFNGDIGEWDVSKVTDMRSMFLRALSFNGDIGNWDVSHVTNMYLMFKGVALSTENYDGLLLGWSELELQPNVAFDAGDSAYCSGGEARQSMVGQFNWAISDAGRLDVEVQDLKDQEAQGYFTFPEISGKNLGDTKAFYTEPDGRGDKFDSGDEIGFERFESYPVTLYAYYKTTGGCSDQESFQLTIVPLEQEGLVQRGQ